MGRHAIITPPNGLQKKKKWTQGAVRVGRGETTLGPVRAAARGVCAADDECVRS
jgi:hypothetical protein